MNENLKIHLADFIKWVLIIIIAAIAFYIASPKYYFQNANIRCNKVTGKTEINRDGSWEEIHQSNK